MSRASTSESTKRNLSSSSSPNTRVKITKTFVSPNRFSVLATEKILPEVFSPPSVSVATKARGEIIDPKSNSLDDNVAEHTNKPPPPIVLSNVTNYSALIAVFTSLVGADGFTATAKGTSLYVKTRNCTDHFKLIDYINDQDLKAHTWAPRHNRPIKVFIRHLHYTIAIEDIESALTVEGFSVINVSNIHHRVSKQALSLFSVTLTANESNRRIYQLSYLLNSKIAVEKPHQARFPPQCKQCQRYGHTQGYCNESPRCVKCSNNHHTNDCTKSSSTPAKCALCAGAHTANYKGCPSAKKFSKIPHKKDHTKFTPPTVPTKDVPVTDIPPLAHTRRKGKNSAKTYANITAGSSNNLNTDTISVILSQFVTQLNSLITPLISLVSTLLQTLISKNTVSP